MSNSSVSCAARKRCPRTIWGFINSLLWAKERAKARTTELISKRSRICIYRSIPGEPFAHPEIDFQKDFLEDRLICALDLGVEWAWGKKPAEEYPREVSFEGAAGVAYRFAPNWYAGVEIHTRWEYPLFDLYNFEHRVFYAGPSIHYSQKNWWATLTWNYQVYGKGVEEPADGQTFAEETRQLFRLKVGFNF